MKFLDEVVGEYIRGTEKFRLVDDLNYQSDLLPEIITVPAGFETDFASIPKCLWWYIAPSSPQIRDAAVIHDFLYSTQLVPRLCADTILREAMKSLGASILQRTLVYTAVRIGGASHY